MSDYLINYRFVKFKSRLHKVTLLFFKYALVLDFVYYSHKLLFCYGNLLLVAEQLVCELFKQYK